MLRALVAQLDAAHEEVKQGDGGDVDDVAAALEELVEQLPAWARESVDGVVGSGGGSGAAERLRAEVRSLAAPALPPRPLDTARRAADLRSAAEAELAAMEAAERRAEPLPPPPPPTDPVEDEAPPPPPPPLMQHRGRSSQCAPTSCDSRTAACKRCARGCAPSSTRRAAPWLSAERAAPPHRCNPHRSQPRTLIAHASHRCTRSRCVGRLSRTTRTKQSAREKERTQNERVSTSGARHALCVTRLSLSLEYYT